MIWKALLTQLFKNQSKLWRRKPKNLRNSAYLYDKLDVDASEIPNRENPDLKNPPGLRGRYILRNPLST